MLAPTTRKNVLRVLRAMQLPKPGISFQVPMLLSSVPFFFLLFIAYITSCLNILICLCSPVLLEGSPGVGKTSLIVALGKFSGHKVVRINLSEQVGIIFQLSYFYIA